MKGIKKEFSVPRTPQQDRITERKNRTLIEAARTMLADSLIPISFWAKAVNTACYVQNRGFVTKPQNKTPYELLLGRTPSIGFMRPFGCPVTILNTLDPLGKFDGKVDKGFLVGYSNTDDDAAFGGKKPEFEGEKPEFEVHVSPSSSAQTKKHDDKTKREDKGKSPVESSTGYRNLKADFTNLETTITVCPIPTTRVHKDHLVTQIIGDLSSATQTRSMTRVAKDHGGLSQINNDDFYTCMFACFLSQEEPKRAHQALKDPSLIEAMQEELLQFKMQKVWVLVDLPNAKRAIGTKWVFRNKKDERGIVVRNKARLVAQGHTQEEGINYEEVFAPVARKETIRLFLAYASFMGFMVYQMDVKSAFLYGTIEEEVYVCQPPVFEDPDYPDKVYKVVKALYGLHQALRGWNKTLANYLLENGFQRGKIDQILFIKRQKSNILLVQIYIDDIIFGSTNKDLCKAFEKLMKNKFQMSSIGELTFFLGLQVKQKPDGIFISQDKYVPEILRKVGLTDGKSASTPIDTEKPLLKDLDGEDVDVHTYRSMIGSLMYLTSSRPDIMFAVCACARFQVTSKALHLHAMQSRGSLDILRASHTWACDASERFDQIINFLNASSIKYALTVNPNIYVSCIKQCWSSVLVENVNDVTRLQALVDKKKVIITEATIRDDLRLDDAKSIDCLPNEEIFTELSRMGYEKPSNKLTFYKAFLSPQWKFLIHTILQCMSAKRMSWNDFSFSMASAVIRLSTGRKFNFSKYIFDSLVRNVDSSTKFYMYPRFLQLMIRAQVGDVSSHSTKYSSSALTQKVFANMRRVGKGFSKVDTPLFEGMIVAQKDDDIADEGAASVAVDNVPAAIDEPSIPSPLPTTQPPPPSQDLPSTSQDKIAQSLEITKLKQMVKKLERRNKLKVSKLRKLKRVGIAQRVDTSEDTVMDDRVGIAQRVDTSEDTVMDDVSKQGRIIANMDADEDVTLKDVADIAKEVALDAEIEGGADVQGRQAESQAQIYQIGLEHANKVLSMQDDEVEPAELQEVVEVVTTGKLMTEIVTAASATVTAATTSITTARKEKEDNVVMRYQALKRKPQTEAQARKNMMIYLMNMAGFKMDYFKRISYDHIRPIFEKKFNSNVAFLEKIREQMEDKDNKALKRTIPNDEDDVYTEATPLARKVPVADYEIYTENNKPYYKIIRADRSPQLFLSFLSLLRNFDREDLKMILLVERRYPLTRFTLDQMLNNVRLEVEEESEVSLELLRFVRQQQQEGFRPE
nr:retrovirus-related Pol polyprotein from transposon TNT 1-94 [Tanacetum cinerariifolium]